MTRQRKNRAISVLLVVVMVLGMIPMITKAAEEPKVEASMKLEHAFDFSLISALCHSDELGAFQNYYTSPVTRGGFGKNPLEWTLLSYAMEFGQNIDLELWRLPDSYQTDERNPIQLLPNTESDAPEEFLEGGVKIGYLNGYKIEDHLEEVGDGHYKAKDDYPPGKLKLVFMDAVKLDLTGEAQNPDRERVTMFQQFVIGYNGPLPSESNEGSQQFSLSYDDSDFFKNPPSFSMWGEKITNYFLWDGRVCESDGTEIEVDYTTGRYIIVMTPNDEQTKLYNRFVAFSLDMSRQSNDLPQEQFNEKYDELSLQYCVRPGDPVDLLSGSFTWNYTDTALYGEYDLEYMRDYSSKRAKDNLGLGYGWADNYHTKLERFGASAAITLPGGAGIHFVLSADGKFYSDPGSFYQLERQGDGYRLSHKNGTVYLYDAEGQIQSISRLDGNVINFTHADGKVATVSNRAGSFTFGYNGNGNLSSVTDSVGRVTTLSYDGDYLVSVTNTDGDALRYTYDENGYLTTVEDFKGEVYVQNEYDEIGRVVKQYVKDDDSYTFTYDEEARVNTCMGESGKLDKIRYDALGRIVEHTTNSGTKTVTYDNLNRRTSESDWLGNITYYEYDDIGNVTKITYPDGLSEQFTYNSDNQVVTATDRNGDTVSYTYNSAHRLSSITDGRGNKTIYQYDGDGNLTATVDGEGAKTTYTYDAAGNCLTETDALGQVTHYAYDEQGRLSTATYPDGSNASYEYTTAGKLVKVTDAAGSVQTYTVDGNGFNTSQSDWLGNVTRYAYNTQNQLTSVTDPMNEF